MNSARPQTIGILILLTSHNRREFTTAVLRNIAAQLTEIEWAAVVFDDGSTDGTPEAVERLGGPVTVLRGDGSSFWAAGMASAESWAIHHFRPHQWLWVNDDVDLHADALARLILLQHSHPNSIIIGAMQSRASLRTTYSGMRRVGIHPLALRKVDPGPASMAVEAFNGNLVLIPRDVRDAIGNIDGAYPHALADIDYSLRARLLNIPIILGPRYFGFCETNPPSSGSMWTRWSHFRGIKGGGNVAGTAHYLAKASPKFWRLFLWSTAVKWWISAFVNAITARRA